jgi:hypothetical protein
VGGGEEGGGEAGGVGGEGGEGGDVEEEGEGGGARGVVDSGRVLVGAQKKRGGGGKGSHVM